MQHRATPLLAVAAALATAAVAGTEPAGPLPPPEREAFHQDVAWSPDGEWIAFSEYEGGEEYDGSRWSVWIAQADGAERSLVAGNAMWASWSPDGRSLAISSPRGGNRDLYTVHRDGSGLHRLTEHSATDTAPAWSPDGTTIAFTSDREGNSEIYVMGAGGGRARRLTDDPRDDHNPSWSPDGKTIVFYRAIRDGVDQIRAIGRDGEGERAITDDGALNTFPSFRPDGRIAFSSKRDGFEGAVTVSADGTREPVGGAEGFFFRWSPDGKRIAFVSGGWPKSAIYLMHADGSGIRKIVN